VAISWPVASEWERRPPPAENARPCNVSSATELQHGDSIQVSNVPATGSKRCPVLKYSKPDSTNICRTVRELAGIAIVSISSRPTGVTLHRDSELEFDPVEKICVAVEFHAIVVPME